MMSSSLERTLGKALKSFERACSDVSHSLTLVGYALSAYLVMAGVAKLMETRNKRLPSSKYDSQDDDEQHTSQKKNKGGENKKKNNNSPDKDGDEKEDRKDAALPIDRTSVYAKGLKSVDPHAPEFHSYSNIYNIPP